MARDNLPEVFCKSIHWLEQRITDHTLAARFARPPRLAHTAAASLGHQLAPAQISMYSM